MKSCKKEFWFNTSERVAFINITEKVENVLEESGIKILGLGNRYFMESLTVEDVKEY